MKNILYFILALILFSSCEKEIELDYNDIDPIPVIEGKLTPEKVEVKITKTRNMNDSTKGKGLECESVILTQLNGQQFVLNYDNDGFYRLEYDFLSNSQNTYMLNVKIDGVTYCCSSTLYPQAEITEPRFVWTNLMDWAQCLEFEIIDKDLNTENYYWYNVYKNGEIYCWAIVDDTGCDSSGIIYNDYLCYYDSDMENDDDAFIYDGDIIEMEVKSIDQQTFDYLSELQYGNNNPKQVFKSDIDNKKCLGYFTAYNPQNYKTVYNKTPHKK
ncbi:MAG: DUF4249 domain-containing protein [Bacteroidales bacterium]|nr:DUF4249 domain-containing protein [Bacteroidales bacterium]